MKIDTRIKVSLGLFFSTLLFNSTLAWSQEGTVHLDPLSLASLRLEILHDDVEIGSATGFVLEKNNKHYLLTNRHVVLSCIEDRGAANVGGWICANRIGVYHNRQGRTGQWFWVTEDLLDANHNKRWFEHPTLGGAADLVALPLVISANVQFYPVDVATLMRTDMALGPGEPVSIVGFPRGQAQQDGLPIWKTGTIASDLDINYAGKPIFLVDTTSRPGMSGSPVYAVRTSGFRSSKTGFAIVVGNATKFLGVYAAQSEAIEVGLVWKADAVMTLYESLP